MRCELGEAPPLRELWGSLRGCVWLFGCPGRKFGGGSLAPEETGRLRPSEEL